MNADTLFTQEELLDFIKEEYLELVGLALTFALGPVGDIAITREQAYESALETVTGLQSPSDELSAREYAMLQTAFGTEGTD